MIEEGLGNRIATVDLPDPDPERPKMKKQALALTEASKKTMVLKSDAKASATKKQTIAPGARRTWLRLEVFVFPRRGAVQTTARSFSENLDSFATPTLCQCPGSEVRGSVPAAERRRLNHQFLSSY